MTRSARERIDETRRLLSLLPTTEAPIVFVIASEVRRVRAPFDRYVPPASRRVVARIRAGAELIATFWRNPLANRFVPKPDDSLSPDFGKEHFGSWLYAPLVYARALNTKTADETVREVARRIRRRSSRRRGRR